MSASERARSSTGEAGSDLSVASLATEAARPAEGPRAAILRLVREDLVPLVRAGGGEIHLVSADDAGVTLHLSGRYSGCPGNTLARRRVLEPLISRAAPGVILTVTSGALIPPGAERLEPV